MKKIIFIIIVITFGIQYAQCNEMIITEPEKIVVSVCDIARNSGVFLVEIKNKDIKRSLRYISTNNFCWTVKHITDIDSCTQKYLRKSRGTSKNLCLGIDVSEPKKEELDIYYSM